MRNPKRHQECRITELRLNDRRVLYLENAWIRVGVDVDKGAEIFEFRHKATDVDAIWHRDYDPPSRPMAVEGAGNSLDVFFDAFTGGWQESFPVGNSFGAFGNAELYLHGEVSLLPWDFHLIEDTADYIEVELVVACRRTPFVLRRRMSIGKSQASVHFSEIACNVGRQPHPFAWGHHPSFGAPLLDATCRYDLPRGIFRSWNPRADLPARLKNGEESRTPHLPDRSGTLVDLTQASPADAGTIDNYYIEIQGDAIAALRNPSLDLGVGLVWDANAMPYLWKWDVCHAASGYPLWGRDYLTAFEPFNCPIGGLLDDNIRAALPMLNPGSKTHFAMTVGWCRGNVPFTGEFARYP